MDADQDGKVTQDEMSSAIDNVLGQLNQQLGMQAGAPPPPPPAEHSADSTSDVIVAQIQKLISAYAGGANQSSGSTVSYAA